MHLATDRRCRPLSIILTPGQAADSPRFLPVLKKIKVRGPVGRPRTRPDAVAGDKAYSSRANRAHLRTRKIQAVIPEKADQTANRKKRGSAGGRPVSHDATLYKDRNTVERGINKIKEWRGLATRYDKTPVGTDPNCRHLTCPCQGRHRSSIPGGQSLLSEPEGRAEGCEPVLAGLVVRQGAFDQSPEDWCVVSFVSVGEFVDEDVVDETDRELHGRPMDVDSPGGAERAPSVAEVAHVEAGDVDTHAAGPGTDAGW
ncbi:transposase, IS4 family [Frankia casuarinae]|uniref:Transposase, IS4 family n=1 Tax=Frankia casuarinae (strain DSM 45818 / CECT 9043 / HFP020203 / CcI3) TaxID=106370 RepID=Q2J5T3_FRACC|nr:transposase, IS4 family [Frankia casuarinae]